MDSRFVKQKLRLVNTELPQMLLKTSAKKIVEKSMELSQLNSPAITQLGLNQKSAGLESTIEMKSLGTLLIA